MLRIIHSTIELCIKLCPWATFHHDKGAFKMHTLLDLRGSIPTFVYLTHGLVHDSKIMDKIPVEPNAYYLMWNYKHLPDKKLSYIHN